MPVIQAFLVEGRTDEAKAAFIEAVTQAAQSSLGAPRESVRVIITDMPAANFGVAGETFRARQERLAKEKS